MSYSDPNHIPFPETYSPAPNGMNSIQSEHKLKLYQALIFAVPICFTFIVLFIFYIIYLHKRNVDWSSLGMRSRFVPTHTHFGVEHVELGLRKEVREMLPIVIYQQSFSINDTLCSVCLGDYEADDKLQQIPACGHTFHMECIDTWLTSHTTCPLCRLSLLSKPSLCEAHQRPEVVSPIESSNEGGEASAQPESEPTTETVISHISDGQESEEDIGEVSKET